MDQLSLLEHLQREVCHQLIFKMKIKLGYEEFIAVRNPSHWDSLVKIAKMSSTWRKYRTGLLVCRNIFFLCSSSQQICWQELAK